MFRTSKPAIAELECRAHGKRPWGGAIECLVCMRVYLCEETEAARIYPNAPANGFCACGSALFPGVVTWGVFSAQPKCDDCAIVLWERQHPATETESSPP